MSHYFFVEFLGGVVAHFLLSVVHCGYLKDDRKVSSGTYGDSQGGDLDSENVDLFILEPEAVVHLTLDPGLDLYNEVDLFLLLNRTHTEQTADVNDSDTAELNIVSDYLGCLSDKRFCAYSLYFHRIVSDKSMASLNKLYGRFAFTDAAVSEDQDTLAVNLYKNAVAGYSRSKVQIEGGDKRGKNCACAFLGS